MSYRTIDRLFLATCCVLALVSAVVAAWCVHRFNRTGDEVWVLLLVWNVVLVAFNGFNGVRVVLMMRGY